jgi:LmbE family N-acetylglucosaminyl deacetylase
MESAVHDEWYTRRRLWLRFVQQAVRTFVAGQDIKTGPSEPPLIAPGTAAYVGQERVVICSPHPDDEALTGALALRFRLERGISVLNIAVTLGSKAVERTRRLRELESSCHALGFRLTVADHPNGLESVTLDGRNDSTSWAKKVAVLTEILTTEQPTVIFVPHEEDFHPTHIGTHHLVLDALRSHMGVWCKPSVMLIETEYWRELRNPNLMVGLSPDMEAILVMATAEHGGEIARNPYHISHPARMIDNVRRGAEVVGQLGSVGRNLNFAELYRVSFIDEQTMTLPRRAGRLLNTTETADPSTLAAYFSKSA